MVFNKINILRIIAIVILSVLLAVIVTNKTIPIETSFVKSILPQNIIQNTKIIPVLEQSSSTIKVVFEADDYDSLEELKKRFINKLDAEVFKTTSQDFSDLLDLYGKTPSNFLSAKTRKLLLTKDYDTVYQQGMERLYNPAGIAIVELNRDPFLLLNDFLLQNNIAGKNSYFNSKYYDTEILKIETDKDSVNQKMAELVKIKSKYSNKNNRIYLAGAPVHTYYTTLSSTISINIICILITLLIVFLTYLYFKRFALLLPIALSIGFGFLSGFAVTKVIYSNLHLITFLFGTTLIGIGIDYSYHYIFNNKLDKIFIKNLTLSLLSTIIAFSLLYLLKIDVLNQIATFTCAGLAGIYLFIIILYPAINFSEGENIGASTFVPKIGKNFKIGIIAIIVTVILFGLPKIKFNDSLASLYSPNKDLKTAEMLFGKVSNQEYKDSTIIAVKGDSNQALLENEEKITAILDENGTNYICISKFLPSLKRQAQNQNLVKDLYKKELNKYNGILSKGQIYELEKTQNTLMDFDISKNQNLKNFLLDSKTSIIVAFSNNLPKIDLTDAEIVNIQATISDYLKSYRVNLLKVFPIIYLIVYLILLLTYGFKQSVKMFIPIGLSALFVISFIGLIGADINMFTLLGLILVLGFTIDYSIFSKNSSQKSRTAVFLACITTTLSFLLLIFTTFKLISMLSLTISLGILSSYLLIKIFSQEK